MIAKIEKPDIFSHLKDDHIWFSMSFDKCGCPYMFTALQLGGEEGVVHNEVVKWDHTIVRQAKKDWKLIVEYCKDHGCNRITALNDNISDKVIWSKFIGLFDFPEPKMVMVSQMEI